MLATRHAAGRLKCERESDGQALAKIVKPDSSGCQPSLQSFRTMSKRPSALLHTCKSLTHLYAQRVSKLSPKPTGPAGSLLVCGSLRLSTVLLSQDSWHSACAPRVCEEPLPEPKVPSWPSFHYLCIWSFHPANLPLSGTKPRPPHMVRILWF